MTTEDFDLENQDTSGEPTEQSEAAENDELQVPVYNKKQVSDIVKREREKAIEKGKREALMELQQQQQTMQQPAQQEARGPGGMPQAQPQMSPEQIKQMLAEHMPQALQEHVAELQNQQLINSFVSKMQAAEAKYPGLESKLNKLDYGTLAPLVKMANEMDNTGDIMHELVSNPMKMGNLLTLMHAQPSMAHQALGDLSNSIKQNQEAKAEEAQAKDPMSQIKSSSHAEMDNASMSVKDFRKMFKT